MTDNLPETASFKEFAGIAGFRPGYITQLKADDRLVLTADGKRVRVAESLQRIADTRDPSKIGVVRRHAAEREAGAGLAADSQETPRVPTQADVEPIGDRIGGQYQQARAVKEKYLAMQAKRDYEVSIGKLLDAREVEGAAASCIATLRQRLESMPDVLAPQLAAINDEPRIRAVIAETVEHSLSELAREFNAIAKVAA